MAPLRIAVVGGSIAGLMAGIALKRLGHDVTVYERTPASLLQDRGAGMGMFTETLQFLEKHDLTRTDAGCKSQYRQWIDKKGEEISRVDFPDRLTGWDILHAILRANFDGTATVQVPNPPKGDIPGKYMSGYCVERVQRKEGSEALKVYLRGENEQESVMEVDMLVCADGAGGSLRRFLLNDKGCERRYAGYVAWRGTAPESKLSTESRHLISDHLVFHHQHHLQTLAYFIPGPTGSLREGERRVNWLWYDNIDEGSDEWKETMMDVDGTLRKYTMPHGKLQARVWQKKLAEGAKKLPPVFVELMHSTDVPFIQAITDNISRQVTFFGGRVIMLGDAVAGFRPHMAASTSQSAFQTLLLEKLMTESKGVLGEEQAREYERLVLVYAKQVRGSNWENCRSSARTPCNGLERLDKARY